MNQMVIILEGGCRLPGYQKIKLLKIPDNLALVDKCKFLATPQISESFQLK